MFQGLEVGIGSETSVRFETHPHGRVPRNGEIGRRAQADEVKPVRAFPETREKRVKQQEERGGDSAVGGVLTPQKHTPDKSGGPEPSAASRFHWSGSVSGRRRGRSASSGPTPSRGGPRPPSPAGVCGRQSGYWRRGRLRRSGLRGVRGDPRSSKSLTELSHALLTIRRSC